MNISAQTKRRWRNRFIFVALVAIGITVWVIYINSFTIYEFGHLIVQQDFGPARPFEPIAGAASLVDGKVRAAQTDYLALYVSTRDTTIAVVDLRNNHTWYSSPPGTAQDPRANPFEQGTMRSNAGFRFFNEARNRTPRGMWLFSDSVYHHNPEEYREHFRIYSIPNGVRFEYVIGSLDIGIDFVPFFIEEEIFVERIYNNIDPENRVEINLVRNFWHPSRDMPGFRQMSEGIRDRRIDSERMVEFFQRVGWTHEDTIAANEAANVDIDISLDTFDMAVEFILDGDRMIANLPLSEFTTETLSRPDILDFLKFFGAGGLDDDGFMLVPSGAGGIITFNNGKHMEEPFMSSVYGMDFLTQFIRPQVTQPVRLPVFGVRNEGAAFVAHVTSGSALATVNAEVAGRTNSYNHAWFSFTLRSSTTTAVTGIALGAGEMTIVQDEIYRGDLTIMYHFLAGENPGVGEMAEAYRNFLVETGVLTPLDGPGDRSFYMDVVGAIDVRRHFMGTPYTTTEIMTTLDDAERFVDILNANGINTIQMQLHGWFNRGINHDVAKNVRPIRAVGNRDEMHGLNARLQADGGGLHPAVNFQAVNWFSRNMNRRFEAARDLPGYIGWRSYGTSRDSLSSRWSHHRNDFHVLVHPGALPFHIDDFLPAFERRTGMDSLALLDLGDIVTESLFRRDAVDRESARLIVEEQMGRIHNEIPNLVVFGGNDFSLQFASHIVDAPIETDLQYIIDYEVPFFPMVVHGFIEFSGTAANMRENYSPTLVLLNSMATGASPRYTFTAEPTRQAQFSPHERLYSTYYATWINAAIEHYNIFNEVFAPLRAETISNFEVLAGGYLYVGGRQVTVTEFSDGTRIYVNNTSRDFDAGGFTIPASWFYVR